MPKYGRRHRLILYTYILNRWWRMILAVGLVLLGLVACIAWLHLFVPQYTPPLVAPWILWMGGGVGAFAFILSIFLLSVRKSAYVQPFDSHLRLVTPFLRMNISYRRFHTASSTDMGRLFPPENYKGRLQALLKPLSTKTAIVLELNGWPLPRWALTFFLSPFFFPDNTPRIALLVPDWIRFSTELESFRSAWIENLHPSTSTPRDDLLASFSKNR